MFGAKHLRTVLLLLALAPLACDGDSDGGTTLTVGTAGAGQGGTTTGGGGTGATGAGGNTSTSSGTAGRGGAGGGGGEDPGVTFHEPAGMTAQIDTGPIVTALPDGFTMYSPDVMTPEGESSANLVRVPDGTGLRLLYQPTLSGGYSPVRFGAPISQPGTTTYYQRWRIRTVANWAGPRNGNGVKLCEPRAFDQGPGDDSGTNHILMMWPNGGLNEQMSAMEALQGPYGHFANLGVNQGLVANLSDGTWHWDERIFVAESTPGAQDGQYYAYLDGTLVAEYTDVYWLAEGGTWGVPSLLFDPTFGGAPATTHPLEGDFWDFDQLYVSTK